MPGTLPDFDLLTSLRYDPKLLTAAYNTDVNGIELPYLFFRFHIERLAAAAAAFGWSRAASVLRGPGATQRLLHMCDQAVMESPLTGKEKGIGVSTHPLFLSIFSLCLCLSSSLLAVGAFFRVFGARVLLRSKVSVLGDSALRWQ